MTSKSGLSFEEEKTLVFLLEKQREAKKAEKAGRSSAQTPEVYDMMSGATLVSTAPKSEKRAAPLHDLDDDWILDAESILEDAEIDLNVEMNGRTPALYLDKGIYIPETVKSWEEWGKTLIKFPSLRSRHLSYSDFYVESIYGCQSDIDELGNFGNWIIKRWSFKQLLCRMQKWEPRHQAQDFGHFLMAAMWSTQRDEIVEVRVAKQSSLRRFKREYKGCVP